MKIYNKILEKFKKGGVLLVLKKVAKVLGVRIENSLERFYFGILSKIKSPVEYRGVLIPTSKKVFNLEVAKRFAKGCYEVEEIEAIDEYMENPKTVIDLGASSGFVSAYINLKFPECDVISLEANPHMISVLEEVKRINRCNFGIVNKAYHSSRKEIEFYIHELSIGGSAQRKTKNKVKTDSTSIECLANRYRLSEFSLIVDIEGGEADLINNEIEVLEDKCSLLVVEFHEGYGEGIIEAKKKLRASNFALVEKKENGLRVYRNKILNKK
jgi:FkbM family methyltransferase